jgi:phosphate-selective porin OprO and OprP
MERRDCDRFPGRKPRRRDNPLFSEANSRRPAMKRFALLVAFAWLPTAMAQSAPAGDQSAAAPDPPGNDNSKKDQAEDGQNFAKSVSRDSPRLRFQMKGHPSIRAGKWLRADFLVRFQQDFRTFNPEVSTDEGEVANLRKLRVGVSGYVTRNFEYKVEREIRNEVAEVFHFRTRETHALWRDVYGNFRYFRRFQLRAGQFKIPFGMDQLHYSSDGELAMRSLIGNYLAPGRDLGLMLHGKLAEGRIAYQSGLFLHDGWKAHLKDYSRSGERTFAGRITLPPLSFLKMPKTLAPLNDLRLGLAVAENPVTEGLRSLRGRTWVITHNWFDRINVRGQRWRLGTELSWEPGPFTLKSEVIRVSDQRLGQGIRGEDLPDLIGRGWYVTTAWIVTGEKSGDSVTPRRSFAFGRGIGAMQIAARYEQLRFGSADHPGLPSRSTRAANLLSASERVATLGVNWYLNRFVRIQYNWIREVIEDSQMAPIAGQNKYWSRYLRIQFRL